jgi:modulator of FtsH protease HflK
MVRQLRIGKILYRRREYMNIDRRIKTSLIGIATDILLIAVKGTLAAVTGSLAIAADAYHSFTDLIVSGVVLMGILFRKREERKAELADGGETPEVTAAITTDAETETATDSLPDQVSITDNDPLENEQKSFGFWVENIVSIGVALMIILVSLDIFVKVNKGQPAEIQNTWLAVIGLAICIAIAYFISRLKVIVGREEDSPALVADGYHSRMDMFSSVAVMFSVMGGWIGINLDPIVAVIIAVIVGLTGIELFLSAVISQTGKTNIGVTALWEHVSTHFRKAVEFTTLHFLGRKLKLPEIGDLFRRIGQKRILTRRTIAAIVVVVLGSYLASGFTVIKPDEIGVRMRFGAIVDSELPPGPHHCLPWPFEKIRAVAASRIYRVEVGFRTDPTIAISLSPTLWETRHQRPGYRKVEEEAIYLTGDENLVDLSIVVHYRPQDAVRHIFMINGIVEVLRGLSESATRLVLATKTADRLMTSERLEVLKLIREAIARQVDKLDLGIEIIAVYCHDLHPPLKAISAFRDVFSAREDKARVINEAFSYRNKALPKARAKSVSRLAGAEAFKTEKSVRAQGDAQKFLLVSEAYRTAPDITGYRLFIETIEKGLAGKKKIIANPQVNRGGYRHWLFSPLGPPTLSE